MQPFAFKIWLRTFGASIQKRVGLSGVTGLGLSDPSDNPTHLHRNIRRVLTATATFLGEFKRSISKKSCLKLATQFRDNVQVKICLREALPYWCMGERYVSLHQACASKHYQERCSNLRESRSSSSSSSGMRKAKV